LSFSLSPSRRNLSPSENSSNPKKGQETQSTALALIEEKEIRKSSIASSRPAKPIFVDEKEKQQALKFIHLALERKGNVSAIIHNYFLLDYHFL
jgi:hypothetical protein